MRALVGQWRHQGDGVVLTKTGLIKTLQVRLTDAQHKAASKAAKAHGTSVADVLREALDRFLTKPCKACKGTGRVTS